MSASVAFNTSKAEPACLRYRCPSPACPHPSALRTCLAACAPSSEKAGTKFNTPTENDTSRRVAQKAEALAGTAIAHCSGSRRSSHGRG